MHSSSHQSLVSKRGEVRFRKILVKQHSHNSIVSPGEPNFEENLQQIRQRIQYSTDIFSRFKRQGVILSPFLEVAAGQGYRSDLLASKFNAYGFASDISQHSLASDRIITKELKLKNQSIKICCDAYNLPFLSSSFPFVFVALALHHFPDPLPVIKEAVRVLRPNGHFYFDEEPIKQGLNLNLWRRDYHLRWFEKILKYTLLLIWLSRIGKAEVDHGILEETFSLSIWEKSLAPFKKAYIWQSVFPFPWKTIVRKKKFTGWIKPNLFVRLGLFLFGGGIGGLAQVKKSNSGSRKQNLFKIFGCPTCRRKDNVAPLKKGKLHLKCVRCSTVYEQKDHVWMLLPKNLKRTLYAQKN